jgi:hypothetical protein
MSMSKPTGRDIVNKARTCKGDKYVFGVEVKLTDPDPKAEDCSELVEWVCAQNGVQPVMPDGAMYQVRHCRKYGFLISVAEALKTPGALLFFFSDDPFEGDQRPDMAHVSISQGNTMTIEARSTRDGVGEFPAEGRGWTHAGLIPGVDYGETEDVPEAPEAPDHVAGKMVFRVTAAGGVNIRSGPGMDNEVWDKLAQGAGVEAAGPPQGDWQPVAMEDGSVGWIAARYLERVEEEAETDALEAAATAGEDDFTSTAGTIAAIRVECAKQGLGLPDQAAYVLATVEWETAGTFKPVEEAYYLGSKADAYRQGLRYYPYYGRGYVQLTWENNYRKYAQIMGLDLVGNPTLALEPKTALFILVHGFKTGAFTGKKLTDYINGDGADFVEARRCINGTDKAEEIAGLAEKYLEA